MGASVDDQHALQLRDRQKYWLEFVHQAPPGSCHGDQIVIVNLSEAFFARIVSTGDAGVLPLVKPQHTESSIGT